MASNYEVNIKLNTRTVNKQLNNLEKRISKLNKLAQGGRASRTVLQNEKHKIDLASKHPEIVIKISKIPDSIRTILGDKLTGIKGKEVRPVGKID